MPLPQPAERKRLHRRTIEIDGYERADGLFDIEGRLVDFKDFDFKLAEGIRAAGEPVHDMWVRITLDRDLNVIDACAVTDAMPYQGECNKITPDYARLKGHKIAPGFRNFLAALFGTTKGCSHLTELLGTLGPAAVQTVKGTERARPRDPNRKPFQLDGCHALVTTGEVVAKYYPRWYRQG
jgi:Protein of unknown function (DUF2889)